jgi:hypothetical protein
MYSLNPGGKTMKTSRRRLFAAAALALFSLSMASGCSEEEAQAFFVSLNMRPDTSCELKVTGGQQAFISSGFLDLAVTNEYWMFPQFINGLTESNEVTGLGPEQLRLDNNTISLKGARVYYDIGDVGLGTLSPALELPQHQYIPMTGFVEADAEGLTAIQIVPPLVGEILRFAPKLQKRYSSAQMILRIVFEGKLLDGSLVKSNEFEYPVTVCNGCLISYGVAPSSCCDPAFWEDIPDAPCILGQDDGIDCRLCCATAATAAERQKCLP